MDSSTEAQLNHSLPQLNIVLITNLVLAGNTKSAKLKLQYRRCTKHYINIHENAYVNFLIPDGRRFCP